MARIPPHLKPTIGLLVKLGSVVVHADEITEGGGLPTPSGHGVTLPSGHELDVVAIRSLLADPEVQLWVKEMGPMLPRKRSTDATDHRG